MSGPDNPVKFEGGWNGTLIIVATFGARRKLAVYNAPDVMASSFDKLKAQDLRALKKLYGDF